jgi:nitrile hydratase
MDPVHYLDSSYYEHWLTGATTLAVERGVVSLDDLVARAGSFPLSRPVDPHPVVGDPPSSEAARFSVGDRVRVRNVQTKGHTRCPGYVRGREGTVTRINHAEPVPELEAHADQRVLEACYAVTFDAAELWGDDAEPASTVTVDLMERYLA